MSRQIVPRLWGRGLRVLWLVVGTLFWGCGDDGEGQREIVAANTPLAVFATERMWQRLEPAFRDLPVELHVRLGPNPSAAMERQQGLRSAIVDDLDCEECFRLEGDARGTRIRCGRADPLGCGYGLAHWLEILGLRFFQPFATFVPDAFELGPRHPSFSTTFTPEIALRGLHLHTLHPIEALADFWLAEPEGRQRAERVLDWTLRNRGNFVQWVALNDIAQDPARHAQWAEHTRWIVDQAHMRGLQVGLAVQLFSSSNLQNAFNLLDRADDPDPDETMIQRWRLLFEAAPFDWIMLSFGEFFGENPEAFVEMVRRAYTTLRQVAPKARMSASIHLGNYPNLRVQYAGRNLLYYFLVDYASVPIEAWVHTVMYFNLFEPAAGAYNYEDFTEHREYLLEKLRQGIPVGYHPESAYWIAFDNSVPLYFPVYIRSRWLDLAEIRRLVPGRSLTANVIFSSGWEWGYWQNDVTSLRMSYRLPERWKDLVADLFAPFGPASADTVEAVTELGELQSRGAIWQRLAAYLAGRDAIIDLGDRLGIHSQPDRPEFREIQAWPSERKAEFRAAVLEPLAVLAEESERIQRRWQRSPSSAKENPWLRELGDGLAIQPRRAKFIEAVYRAALAVSDGNLAEAQRWRAVATEQLQAAQAIVTRRHASLLDPAGDRWLNPWRNPTLYQYGYLNKAHTLCYWQRELAQLDFLLGERPAIPDCFW